VYTVLQTMDWTCSERYGLKLLWASVGVGWGWGWGRKHVSQRLPSRFGSTHSILRSLN
jgi:hypothetical protein